MYNVVFVLAFEEEEVKPKVTTTTNEECVLLNQVRRKTKFICLISFLSDRTFEWKLMLKAIFNISSIYKRISILHSPIKVSIGTKVSQR